MATRKIKDARDNSTNELIYFKGHAGATYMSNGATVEDTVNHILHNKNVYEICNMGSTDSEIVLSPNVFYVWDEIQTLDITLGDEIDGIINEYLFQFNSGEVATTLILSDAIKWINGTPQIAPNKTYQCSIVNNIGIICGV